MTKSQYPGLKFSFDFLNFVKSPTSVPQHQSMEDVVMVTSMGTIVCEMYYDHTPRTCKNFVELVCPFQKIVLTHFQAKRKYYNGVIVPPL